MHHRPERTAREMANEMTRAHGTQRHLLADLWDCSSIALADELRVQRAMLTAASRSGATVVDKTFHRFRGGGITGIVAVKESHLTIHTWPERRYAAVDIFLCGQANPHAALAHLVAELGAKRHTVREYTRGQAAGPPFREAPTVSGRGGWRGPMALLYLVTLVVAMCSIIYELLLAQTLSALLGNTVLRYSITIGCFLGALGVGALLCGNRRHDAGPRLIRIELALSVLGGAAVPLFYFLDTVQRFVYVQVDIGSVWETLTPLLFLLATHVVIVGIGLLSGFEVPLLLALGEDLQPRSTNKLLGVDYLGALVGSVLFPVVLLRSFGLLATGLSVAAVNAVAALILIAWRGAEHQLRMGLAAAVVAAVLLGTLAGANTIEQYFLKKFYYASDVVDLASLIASQPQRPDIERYRSPYQTIDLVTDGSDTQWIYDQISTKLDTAPDYPRRLWLFLDREYQLFSGMDEIYHEWFVHAPVQANGRSLRDVLVLGGGDGLAIRELLKYDTVQRVLHVDIDPQMLHLARHHPLLSSMNGHADEDPRVTVVEADAFHWLRMTRARFDAVYIDMPAARDYNLALVYSREFYAMVRHHLEPPGFVAIDTPSGWCGEPDNWWDIYYNTLRAAGFATVVPMLTHLDSRAPRIANTIDQMVAVQQPIHLQVPGGQVIRLTDTQARAYVRGALERELEGNLQEFTLAFPTERPVNTTWREDLSVPMHVFGPRHLPLAFRDTCSTERDPVKVNSIVRPTLPDLELLSIRFP